MLLKVLCMNWPETYIYMPYLNHRMRHAKLPAMIERESWLDVRRGVV